MEKKSKEIATKEDEIKHLAEKLAANDSRPSELKQLPGLAGFQAKVDILEDRVKLSEANLKKSHLCIQGRNIFYKDIKLKEGVRIRRAWPLLSDEVLIAFCKRKKG